MFSCKHSLCGLCADDLVISWVFLESVKGVTGPVKTHYSEQ